MFSLIRSISKSNSWSLSVSTSYSRSKSRSTPDINKLHAKRRVLRSVWQNFTVQKDSHGGNCARECAVVTLPGYRHPTQPVSCVVPAGGQDIQQRSEEGRYDNHR